MKSITPLSAKSLQYYVILRHWISDIEFFKVDTAFLHRLLDDHFIRLCETSHITKLKQVGERLLNLEKNENKANEKLKYQIKELQWITKSLILENNDRILSSRVEMEYLIVSVARQYREVKKDVFILIEEIMRENKLLVSKMRVSAS